MKNHSIIVLILLSLVVSACSWGQGNQSEAQAAQTTPEPTEIASVPVEAAAVETGDITLLYSYIGSLQAKDEVQLMPGVAGRIESVLVEVGDEVTADEPLATIERDRYVIQVRQAQAQLTAAKLNLAKMELGSRPEEIAAAEAAVEFAKANLKDVANIDDNERTTAAARLAQAETALRQAQTEYDKIAWAGDVGSTPQAAALEQATINYENALAAYELSTNPSDAQLAPLMAQLAQAELQLALTKSPFRSIDFDITRSNIEQAQAGLELANLNLDDTTIKAPFEGIIAELYISEGAMASQQAPVAYFISSQMEVVIEVEESRIGDIAPGQHAALSVSAYPDREFPAVVTSVAPLADKDTRTFTVKLTPTDEEGLLRSGMYAEASILADEREGTLLAPRSAVVLEGEEQVVYVVEDQTVERREVTTGIMDDGRIEILSGLEAGETVVTAGQPNLIDGAHVEVVNKL